MLTTRRSFFRHLAAGTAATAGLLPLPDFAFPDSVLPSRANDTAGPIILSRNENAYGPSPKVIAAMQESLTLANRYPDSIVSSLHEKIASSHSVKPEQVVLACGSGEILSIAASAFLGPGKKLITALPTYEFIGHCARTLGAEVAEVPLAKNYSHDLEAMLSQTTATTGLVYICNPNNPTGTITPRRDLEAFIRKLPSTTTVLIDEAYYHYAERTADYSSFIDNPINDDRIIVTRTFSKIFALAGMRVGYAVGAQAKAKALSARRLPEGLNVAGARAALAAYDDVDYVRVCAKRNADDRQEFFNQANARMVPVIDSQTNFAMLKAGKMAAEVIERFRQNNILIGRLFPSMNTYVRVSFGTPAEMGAFWRLWGGKMEMEM